MAVVADAVGAQRFLAHGAVGRALEVLLLLCCQHHRFDGLDDLFHLITDVQQRFEEGAEEKEESALAALAEERRLRDEAESKVLQLNEQMRSFAEEHATDYGRTRDEAKQRENINAYSL